MRQVEKIMKLRQTIKRKIQLAAAIIIPGIILAGCQAPAKQTGPSNSGVVSQANSSPVNKTQPNTDQPAANEVQIEIENFVFKPAEITIAPGTKVTWINKDEAPHTATSTEQKFNSGGLDTDDKFSFVFNEKGDYPYFCSLHPHMKALIKVK
jgi:plastocyanin